MNAFFRPACGAAALVSLLTCSPDSLGPSTEQGNPQIMATVVGTDCRPVPGATVTVYIVPENVDSSQQPQSAVSALRQSTDSRGVCSFGDLPPGSYSLAASDSAANRSALVANITLSSLKPQKPEFSDTVVLAAPGGVKGIVTRGGIPGTIANQQLKDGFIQVKFGELDRATVTGPDGKYTFSNLPPGEYTIFYYATDGFYTSKRENIRVRPAADTTLDTVVLQPVPRLLPPNGFHAVYDSIADIVTLRWHKVVFDSLRWYEVERIDISAPPGTVYVCKDTIFSDTVSSFPSGTVLDYVVRSVDKAFNKSGNAGPLEITVR